MISEKVQSFLDNHHVRYERIIHRPAYTSDETAQSAHIKGRNLAKTVMVKVENWMAMVVLPASKRLSIDELREVVGTQNVRLAREHEFQALFPDCEPGAMPPFGNLYGIDVYVDKSLAEDETIAFNAGSHGELVQMKYTDFERLAQPRVATVA